MGSWQQWPVQEFSTFDLSSTVHAAVVVFAFGHRKIPVALCARRAVYFTVNRCLERNSTAAVIGGRNQTSNDVTK